MGKRGTVDVGGLRLVEAEMQGFASVITLGLDSIVDGWRFLLLVFEFEGDGTSFVTSIGNRENLPDVARSQAERLRKAVKREGSGPTIELMPAGKRTTAALRSDQIKKLAVLTRAVTEMLSTAFPPGWGYGLLLYAARTEGRVWVSDADRDDVCTLLEEFAEKFATHVRPPGVLGNEN